MLHQQATRSFTGALMTAVILTMAVIEHASANFVIQQTRQLTPIIDAPSRGSARVSLTAVKASTPDAPGTIPDRTRPKAPPHPGYPIVHGFGNAIPLREALPMIAPRYVTIHFAAGIDQAMPCSWRSGLPWPATINAAIAPPGLQIIATPIEILITIRKSQ